MASKQEGETAPQAGRPDPAGQGPAENESSPDPTRKERAHPNLPGEGQPRA